MAAVAFEKLELNQKKLSEVGSELESVEMKHKAAVNDFISQELKLNLFMSNIGAMIESFMLWIESAYSQRQCTFDNKYIENIGQHYNAIVDNDSTVGKTFVNSADATLEAQMDYMEKLIGSFSGAPSRKLLRRG
ncbi:hypothetical protein [Pseudomonas syringae]|uniref:hypothetical protein n=1 Tax=Pseudomonas syringae TaxID=317 RepID=UPI003F752DCC